MKRAFILFALGVVSAVIFVRFDFVSAPVARQMTEVSIEGKAVFKAFVSESDYDRAKGLGGTDFLPEDGAMLFVFGSKSDIPPASAGIWMKDMRFPIDIFWIDAEAGGEKTIVGIKEHATPESYPEIFYPDRPASFVLEVPAGSAEKYGIKIGDEVRFGL